jgi:cytochrome P450
MIAAARSATEEHEATGKTEKSGNEAHAGNRADIFQKILSNDALSPSDKTVDRLAQEGFHAITAGSETTGRVLATATYFVLANKPVVMPRLQDELRTVMPYSDSKPPIRDLEQLQWLVGFFHHITSACSPHDVTDC